MMSVGLTVSLMQTEAEGFAQIRTVAVKPVFTLNGTYGTCGADCCQI